MRSIILNINGIPTKCKDIEWSTNSESWLEIKLEDGNIIKLKSVPVQVVRIGDGVNEFGIPEYRVISQNLFVTLVPATDSIDHDTTEATRV